MSMFSGIIESIIATNEKRARALVLNELRALPSRNLTDLGFDTYLLEQGVDAWPWRSEAAEDDAQIALQQTADLNAKREEIERSKRNDSESSYASAKDEKLAQVA